MNKMRKGVVLTALSASIVGMAAWGSLVAHATDVPSQPAWLALGEFNDGDSLTEPEPEPQDGTTEPVTLAGKEGRKGVPVTGGMYIYFNVDDAWLFDADDTTVVDVTVEYFDGGKGSLIFQFDSHDAKAPVNGAYKDAKLWSAKNTGEWKETTFQVKKVKFANRQNGGADFRIALPSEQTAIRKVKLSKPAAQ